MTSIKTAFAIAVIAALLPGVAAADECPEPTDTQGVEVVDGVFTVSQEVTIKPIL